MASDSLSPVIRFGHRVASGQAAHQSDCQLLDRYITNHDEDAFALLVQRHCGLVLGVCRRVLTDWHAAEDCCQAVFMVLALRASSIKKAESLGPWLHGVALKVAGKARTKARTMQIREQQVAVRNRYGADFDAVVWRDLRPVLDLAIGRLPDKYRVPVVLCYLQGWTVSEIAKQLGQPRGTVATRLTRAREILRQRLARGGVTLSATGVTALLADPVVSAALPQVLVSKTIDAVGLVKAGMCVHTSALGFQNGLMKGLTESMISAKLKLLTGILMAASLGMACIGYQGFACGWSRSTPRENVNQPIPDISPTSISNSPDHKQEREKLTRVPVGRLRRSPVKVYRVAPGDTLALVIDKVLGDLKEVSPFGPDGVPNQRNLGYPIPVRDDGTISVPQVPAIKVNGMSIDEIKLALKDAYVGKGKFFEDESQFDAIVNLYRKRTSHVLVIRNDVAEGTDVVRNALLGKPARGTGQSLALEPGQNDLGTALALTGGMPGLFASHAVFIEKTGPGRFSKQAIQFDGNKDKTEIPAFVRPTHTIRIPLWMHAGERWPFTEDDITLENGDVVYLPARQLVAEYLAPLFSMAR